MLPSLLTAGYRQDMKKFSILGPALESAAQRQDRRVREISNIQASCLLKQNYAREEMRAKDAKTSADQFLLAVRRYLTCLALNHDVGYLKELERVTGYLQARQTEPRTRNALRGAHTAIAFIDEVSGAEQASK